MSTDPLSWRVRLAEASRRVRDADALARQRHDERGALMVAAVRDGHLSVTEAAHMAGLTKGTASRILRRAGYTPPPAAVVRAATLPPIRTTGPSR